MSLASAKGYFSEGNLLVSDLASQMCVTVVAVAKLSTGTRTSEG